MTVYYMDLLVNIEKLPVFVIILSRMSNATWGCKVGSCARLGNGPVYRPCASMNSEPRHCASSAFLSFFLHHHAPFTLFILVSSSFFILSTRHAMPPAAVLHHLLFHSSHPPPHCPHCHHCHSQRARYQACPTITTFATSSPYTISPLISPSSFLPPSCHTSAQLHC